LPGFILALYAAVFYGSFSNQALASVWVASIGGMCYSIYLLHNYAIASLGFITERIGGTLPFPSKFMVQMLLMTPFVLAICICFYRLIEQPCMQPDWPSRLKDYLRGKKKDVQIEPRQVLGKR
jgi:peptidoglycan/LPS O-acetylase OafA/YrhL